MKSITLILVPLILLALISTSPAATKYHDFLCKDGRTFRGRILAYDQHANIVSIQRDNKRLIKVSPAVFDEADQLRIKEWNIIRCFQSERLFKISAGRRSCQTKRTVGQSKFDFPGFNIDLSWGTQRAQSTQYTHYYTITFENCSGIALQKMTVEYCIFYSQQRQNEKRRWVEDQGIEHGTDYIGQLNPKSKKELQTQKIIPTKIGDLHGGLFSFYEKRKNIDVKGIWVRITLPFYPVARRSCANIASPTILASTGNG